MSTNRGKTSKKTASLDWPFPGARLAMSPLGLECLAVPLQASDQTLTWDLFLQRMEDKMEWILKILEADGEEDPANRVELEWEGADLPPTLVLSQRQPAADFAQGGALRNQMLERGLHPADFPLTVESDRAAMEAVQLHQDLGAWFPTLRTPSDSLQ